MNNDQYVPGVQYIAGVTFQSSYGVHEAGTVVPEAEKFENLGVLVANRFLWPFAPEQGYEWLPPHLFNDVRLMSEVQELLAGDQHASRPVPQFPDPEDPNSEGVPPQEVLQAEFEAQQQEKIREQVRATSQPGRPKDPGPTPEEVAEEATQGERTKSEPKPRQANPRNRKA